MGCTAGAGKIARPAMDTAGLELGESVDLGSHFPDVDYRAWRRLVERDLKGAPFEKKLVTRTYEGIDVQPLYTRTDWPGEGRGPDASGFSGAEPFTRGARLLNNWENGWDIRQERREPEPGGMNAAILDDLRHGVTSVLVRLDAAGRQGLDADEGAAGLLVGRDGSSMGAVSDFGAAFEGVHLDMIGVGLEAGAAFVPGAALLAGLWRLRGIAPGAARGAFNADPLAVLARDGTLPVSLEEMYGQMGMLAGWTSARWPGVTSVRVGTGPYHHAGATAAQDIGIALATGVEYLRVLTDGERGPKLSVGAAARQLAFSVAIGCHQFLAIAKLRALRAAWARALAVCGASDGDLALRLHVKVSKRVLTARDPWVNVLRGTVCCFAAAVAGAESVTVSPFDEAIGLPTGLSRRLARNTQVVLQEESHLHRVSDPAGGSWFVEKLTEELGAKGWAFFQQIEGQGGMGAALRSGWVQGQIEAMRERRGAAISTRRDAITGVSEFADIGERGVERVAVNYASVLGGSRARVLAVRAAQMQEGSREAGAEGPMGPVPTGTRGGAEMASGWTMDELVERAASLDGRGATVGQLARRCGLRDDVRGERVVALAVHPYAEPFERLRDAMDEFAGLHGYRPRVFLACVGTVSEWTARAGYARGFFEAGGFEVTGSEGTGTVASVCESFAASGAGIAVICSSDGVYERLAEEAAAGLRRVGAREVVLAGNPGPREGGYRASGVSRFIFVRCDVVGTLGELAAGEGVML